MVDQIKPSQPGPTTGNQLPALSGKEPLRLSFKYADFGGSFCLSHCDHIEAKQAMNCLRKLTEMTWGQLYAQGGGGKTGLGFTFYAEGALRKVSRPDTLSADVRIAGIRASDRFRIFGGVVSQTFYVLWFDRNHEIVPSD